MQTVKQGGYYIATIVLLAAMVLPVVFASTVSAEELTDRSIEMSTSEPSATGVEYKINFQHVTSAEITSVVIDFCENSPLIGTACDQPTDFSVASAAFEAGDSSNIGIGTWTPTALNSDRTLLLTTTDPEDWGGIPVVLAVSGIINPSTEGTFYARILTYETEQVAHNAEDVGDGGTPTDSGAVALSTAQVIDVTARVNESITFCVSGTAPGPSCGTVTTPSLTLGDPEQGLQTNAVSEAAAFFQLSTNAAGSTVVKLRNGAASGGLNSGTNSIAPIDHATVAQLLDTGDVGFGVRLPATTVATGGGSSITGASPYASSTTNTFNMRADEVSSTYGDQIASAAGPTSNATVTLTFGAQAGNLTPAGIYTAAIVLIATSTY